MFNLGCDDRHGVSAMRNVFNLTESYTLKGMPIKPVSTMTSLTEL